MESPISTEEVATTHISEVYGAQAGFLAALLPPSARTTCTAAHAVLAAPTDIAGPHVDTVFFQTLIFVIVYAFCQT